MKIRNLFLLAALLCYTIHSKGVVTSWSEYCVKYNRDCSDTEAQSNYNKNAQRLRQNSDQNYVLGQNQMMDQPDDKLRSHRSSLQLPPKTQKQYTLSSPNLVAAAPSQFDWRNQGVVTSIKDQGDCGACWAFASAAHAESKLIMDGRADLTIDLSQQFLTSCTRSSDCGGGLMEEAMPMAKNLPLEKDYPYTPYESQPSDICSTTALAIATNALAGYDVTDEQIIDALLTYGPIPIPINADTGMNFYTSGVYACEYSYELMLNHAVVIVGYTADYWIIKNQWNTTWGESGYIKVTRQREGYVNCGIGAAIYVLTGVPTQQYYDYSIQPILKSILTFVLLAFLLLQV